MEEAEIFAQENGLGFCEASALDAQNVNNAFLETIEGKN